MYNKPIYVLGAALVLAALVISGCSPTLNPVDATDVTSPLATPGSGDTEPTATVPLETQPAPSTPVVPPEAQPVVDQVIADLAQRLNVGVETITVVSVEAVEWPDASLGCPQPGVMYIQVVTPGYQVILEADGQRYPYHTGGTQFVLCEPSLGTAPTAPVTGTMPTPDPTAAPLVDMAKKDLAQRLGVSVETINLVSAAAVQWRDSSMGCAVEGQAYLTVITPGYLIMLEASGQTYEYHSSLTQVVTCENPQAPLEP